MARFNIVINVLVADGVKQLAEIKKVDEQIQSNDLPPPPEAK